MRKIFTTILSCCLCLSVVFGLCLLNTTTVNAQTNEPRTLSLRTDSLTASAEGVTIVEHSGVEVGSIGVPTLQLNDSADYVTFEIDLADDCSGGLIKLFGKNVRQSTVNVGIFIPGYGENDGYYVLAAATNEGVSDPSAALTVVQYGFGNTSWYDAGTKTIRVRVFGAIATVDVTNIAVLDARKTVEDTEVDLSAFNQMEKTIYVGGSVDLYMHNGSIPTYHLAGPVLFEFFVSADALSLTAEVEKLNNSRVFVKNAAGITGDINQYPFEVENGTEIPLTDFVVETEDGVQFKRVVCMIEGGVNTFIQTLKFKVNLPAQPTVVMQEGASVRVGDVSGIRFKTLINAEIVDTAIAEGKTVSFGTLICPLDYITTYGELTPENVFGTNAIYCYDGAQNGKVEILNVQTPLNNNVEDGKYTILGSIVNIKPENITKQFVGIGYVAIESQGSVEYIFAVYANGDYASNARSARYVAEWAYTNPQSSLYQDQRLVELYGPFGQ